VPRNHNSPGRPCHRRSCSYRRRLRPGLALRCGSPAVPQAQKEACSCRRSKLEKKRQAAITWGSPGAPRKDKRTEPRPPFSLPAEPERVTGLLSLDRPPVRSAPARRGFDPPYEPFPGAAASETNDAFPEPFRRVVVSSTYAGVPPCGRRAPARLHRPRPQLACTAACRRRSAPAIGATVQSCSRASSPGGRGAPPAPEARALGAKRLFGCRGDRPVNGKAGQRCQADAQTDQQMIGRTEKETDGSSCVWTLGRGPARARFGAAIRARVRRDATVKPTRRWIDQRTELACTLVFFTALVNSKF